MEDIFKFDIDWSPLYYQIFLMFIFMVIPSYVAAAIFILLRIPRGLVKILVLLIALGGTFIYLKYGLMNEDAWKF